MNGQTKDGMKEIINAGYMYELTIIITDISEAFRVDPNAGRALIMEMLKMIMIHCENCQGAFQEYMQNKGVKP
jgi:hypothetical protein